MQILERSQQRTSGPRKTIHCHALEWRHPLPSAQISLPQVFNHMSGGKKSDPGVKFSRFVLDNSSYFDLASFSHRCCCDFRHQTFVCDVLVRVHVRILYLFLSRKGSFIRRESTNTNDGPPGRGETTERILWTVLYFVAAATEKLGVYLKHISRCGHFNFPARIWIPNRAMGPHCVVRTPKRLSPGKLQFSRRDRWCLTIESFLSWLISDIRLPYNKFKVKRRFSTLGNTVKMRTLESIDVPQQQEGFQSLCCTEWTHAIKWALFM